MAVCMGTTTGGCALEPLERRTGKPLGGPGSASRRLKPSRRTRRTQAQCGGGQDEPRGKQGVHRTLKTSSQPEETEPTGPHCAAVRPGACGTPSPAPWGREGQRHRTVRTRRAAFSSRRGRHCRNRGSNASKYATAAAEPAVACAGNQGRQSVTVPRHDVRPDAAAAATADLLLLMLQAKLDLLQPKLSL